MNTKKTDKQMDIERAETLAKLEVIAKHEAPQSTHPITVRRWVGGIDLTWKDPDRANSGAISESLDVEWNWTKDEASIRWRIGYRRGGTRHYRGLTEDKIRKIVREALRTLELKIGYWLQRKAKLAMAEDRESNRRTEVKQIIGWDPQDKSPLTRYHWENAVIDLNAESPFLKITLELDEAEAFAFLREWKARRAESSQ